MPRTLSTIVQTTNLGITVKDSPQSTLVFVTSLDAGEPVADARVSIVNTANTIVWSGTTGRDGVVLAPALPLRTPDRWWELSFILTVEKDGDLAYVGSDWNEGISPWDFGTSYQLWEATDILRGSVFTDRGVYRPGEEVRIKTIARLDTPQGIRLLPAGSTLDVRVRDGRGQEVDRRRVPVGRWSSVEWAWTVPESATLGSYQVEALIPGTERPAGNDGTPVERNGDWLKRVSGSFLVAAYRRPDFRVDATLTADPAVAGTTLRGTVAARYLFGSTLGGRPVRWWIQRTPDSTVPAAILERFPRDRYAFGYYARGVTAPERLAGEDARLDEAGRLAVALPVEAGVDRTFRYTLEGDVEDVSRQRIANRAAMVVHPAPWHIGLRRPDYFATVEAGTSVDVLTVDPEGRTVPGVEVTLDLVRIQWNSVRRAEGGGFYTWESERLERPAGQWTVTTGDAPVAVTIPVPDGGSYELRATAAQNGRRTRTDVSFYGLGRGYTAWQRFDHNRITLEPERETWKPGERARIMVQSPWESATALVTVEREGIRRYERFTLTSTQQTIEVPVSEADIPNIFVSVLLIRGRTSSDPGDDGSDPGKPAFRLGYTEITVEDATKRLTLDVTADREEYRPANRARVSVGVRDEAGQPVQGEVTLWAVDYGVLSLTGYQPPDVLRAVYRRKALQVMNADNRQRIISRRVLTPKGASEGGGGGGEGNVRQDFRPLAFWLGSVETDADGRASADVTLPESLTTYRIMAVAGDARSRFGFGDAEMRVTKPLTLLPALPRFLTLGDRASIGAVATNTRTTGGQATVTVQSLDPAVVAFTGSRESTVTLGPGGTEAVRFEAAARAVGTARVRMTVSQGDESDAFEIDLPVVAPAPPEVTAAFGDTEGRAVERLRIPEGILPAAGGLDVSLATTALVGLGEGVRYLADYPYGGAEPRASGALALALAADLGTAFSMSNIAPADYRARAATMLAELPRYQCADGGFGWPGCRHGDPYLTSWVLDVVHAAAELGFEPQGGMVVRALDFLQARMNRAAPQQVQWVPCWAAITAYGVRTLVQHGRNQDSNITRLVDAVDRMPVFALSYLVDAVVLARPDDPRAADLRRRLANAARVEGDQAHVEELDDDLLGWLWNSNVRSTAIVLEGLVRRGDDPVLVQRMVRWLLGARENGRWRNTQENATALHALVRYYKAFEATPANLSATVALGSETIGTAAFRGRTATAEHVTLAMPDLLRQAAPGTESELAISREGTGRLYYTTRFQFTPLTPPPPTDQGLRVERRYERFVEGGTGPEATAFDAGDLIRVTLTVSLPVERRYLAVTDTLPGGVEAVDGWFRTTAADLAREASVQSADESWEARWRGGGFDHVEKYDDRIVLFATRLSQGRHEFSYVVRATTSGTFSAAGVRAAQLYAPEVNGRSAPTTVVIR
ncbi:MAG TPA: MG2 domain-containing protein [Vicinamibacterales bacterium]|nr:MG2 domain-containing protein [Vicinamibacterales bacterium]